MNSKFKKYIEKIPTWAICYIVNGDCSNLTEEEISMIDKWVNDSGYEIISPVMYDPDGNEITGSMIDYDWSCHEYFSHYPAFGEPGEVMDCYCLIKNVETVEP